MSKDENTRQWVEIDNLILEMEVNQEKAFTMSSLIDQEYFDLDNDQHKLYYFDKASTYMDILHDYVYANVALLEKAREFLRNRRDESAELQATT